MVAEKSAEFLENVCFIDASCILHDREELINGRREVEKTEAGVRGVGGLTRVRRVPGFGNFEKRTDWAVLPA